MSTIYKYLPPERRDYFDSQLLRFTQPATLNDPFECLPIISDITIRQIAKQATTQPVPPPIFSLGTTRQQKRKALRAFEKAKTKSRRKILNDSTPIRDEFYRIRRSALDELGILSLSQKWNNPLMWAHYTRDHRGFCIGYDTEHEFFSKFPSKFGLSPLANVRYAKIRSEVLDNDDKESSATILLTKSEDWRYEEEVRMIRSIDNPDKVLPNKDESGYDIKLFKVPHEAISEIILGLRANQDDEKTAINLAEKYKIPIYKAAISEKSFDFDRKLFFDTTSK